MKCFMNYKKLVTAASMRLDSKSRVTSVNWRCLPVTDGQTDSILGFWRTKKTRTQEFFRLDFALGVSKMQEADELAK